MKFFSNKKAPDFGSLVYSICYSISYTVRVVLQVELAVGVVVKEEELDQDGGGLRVLDNVEATAVLDPSVLVAEGGHVAADFGRCGVLLAPPCPALHPAAFVALGGITVDGEEELRAAGIDQLADLLEVGGLGCRLVHGRGVDGVPALL